MSYINVDRGVRILYHLMKQVKWNMETTTKDPSWVTRPTGGLTAPTLGVSKEGWRGSGLSSMENTVFSQLLGDSMSAQRPGAPCSGIQGPYSWHSVSGRGRRNSPFWSAFLNGSNSRANTLAMSRNPGFFWGRVPLINLYKLMGKWLAY